MSHWSCISDGRSTIAAISLFGVLPKEGMAGFPLFHVNGIGSSLPIPSSYHVAESILNTELKLYHTEQAEAEDLSR